MTTPTQDNNLRLRDAEGNEYILRTNYDPTTGVHVPVADVNIQDQTSPAFSLYFNQKTGDTTLGADAAFDAFSITVADATGIDTGSYIGIFSLTTGEFYFGSAVATPVGNVVQLDTPLSSAFLTGDLVSVGDTEMVVDGSTTPEVFRIAGPPGGGFEIDITRIIVTMRLTSAPDDGLFGNIARLTKGVTIRRRDGETNNLGNFKDNSDLANLCYDITYSPRSGGGGTWGLRARWTFAGQSEMGVANRLGAGDFLEAIIADDLTTGSDITSFRIIGQGHVVV